MSCCPVLRQEYPYADTGPIDRIRARRASRKRHDCSRRASGTRNGVGRVQSKALGSARVEGTEDIVNIRDVETLDITHVKLAVVMTHVFADLAIKSLVEQEALLVYPILTPCVA